MSNHDRGLEDVAGRAVSQNLDLGAYSRHGFVEMPHALSVIVNRRAASPFGASDPRAHIDPGPGLEGG